MGSGKLEMVLMLKVGSINKQLYNISEANCVTFSAFAMANCTYMTEMGLKQKESPDIDKIIDMDDLLSDLKRLDPQLL